jgi:hypothetical protein
MVLSQELIPWCGRQSSQPSQIWQLVRSSPRLICRVSRKVSHDKEFVACHLKRSEKRIKIGAERFSGIWICVTCLAHEIPLPLLHVGCLGSGCAHGPHRNPGRGPLNPL